MEAKLDVILAFEKTAVKLDGMADKKCGTPEIEDYAMADVVTINEVSGRASESDDMDGNSIEKDLQTEVDMMTSFPDVYVLISEEPTIGGNDARLLAIAVLVSAGVLEAIKGTYEEVSTADVLRVIETSVRLGGAMLSSHSVDPLTTE